MTLEDIAIKVIPPLVVMLVVTVAGVVVNVYIMDSKLEANKVTDAKQWDFISNNKTSVVQLQEQQKHNLSKEQYYREKK